MPIEELQTCINEKSDTLSLQYSGEDPADLIAEVAQALKAGHLTNVTSLDLGGSAIAKEHIEMLADLVFPHMPQLQDLDFRHNDLETEGAVLLRPALEKYCRNLTALDVSENRLRDLGAREIAGLLMALPNMKSVRLGSNQLTAKCVPSIVAGLRKAQSLTFLGLEFNGLGDQGVIDLLNGIRGHCVNLAHINLSDLCLTDDAVTRGIVPYIQASKRAQRLQQIDLSVNKIGAIGAVALAVAFRTTQVLDTVDLGCNPIGEAGNVAIAEALSNPRCSVTHIDLSATEMTPTAFEALRVAVSRNLRIMKLRTGSNDQITGEMHSQIQDLLAVRSASAISAAPVSDFSGSTMAYLALGSAIVAVALYGVWRVTRR